MTILPISRPGSGDLTLRINDGTTDRLLSNNGFGGMKFTGLTFRKVAPGGAADLQVHVNLPLSTWPDLGPEDKVYLYDTRTAQTVWEGFAKDPGNTAGPQGDGFDLNTLGISTLASDKAEPLTYRSSSYDAWIVDDTIPVSASATNEVGVFPDGSSVPTGSQCVVCQLNPGAPVGTGSGRAAMIARWFTASQTLGAVDALRECGMNSSDFAQRLAALDASDAATNIIDTDLSTSGIGGDLYAGTDFPAGTVGLRWALAHTGAATNIADDTTWAALQVVAFLGDRLNPDGTEAAIAPRTGYVLASEVVADLIGRLVADIDPNRVGIDASAYQIDQLAFPTPSRMQDVMDALAVYEPDFTWEFLPSAGGLYGFNYRAWDTTSRYEISTRDGFTQPGSDVDLCNRITVGWTDAKGQAKTTVVTSVVPALGDRTRDADPVNLPDGQGSASNATRLGQQILAGLASPPKSATASVARPILDRQAGRLVMPWEIEPGYLVRVRETGDDLRLTEMTYDHDTRTAALTLGTPVLTEDQRIAQLYRKAAS